MSVDPQSRDGGGGEEERDGRKEGKPDMGEADALHHPIGQRSLLSMWEVLRSLITPIS